MDEYAFTSVQALAEILQGRLEPAMRDSGNYEFEDLCDEVRNAYAGVLWKIHMANMADGDRTALESQLARKFYSAEPTTDALVLTGAMIIDLPRDAGVYSVVPATADKAAMSPLTKTTPAMAFAPKSKMDPGRRYYRIGDELYFPDDLPDCTAYILVIFYGLDTSDVTAELIPRDYADMVRDKLWNSLFPSKQIQADTTNQSNPNV